MSGDVNHVAGWFDCCRQILFYTSTEARDAAVAAHTCGEDDRG